MIHVVIDTNIFRKSPRLDSPEFKSLATLAQKECVRIHVPYIVEREFRTHLEIEQRKVLSSAEKSISSAIKYEKKGPKTEALVEILEKLRNDADEIANERGEAFELWLTENNAEKHALTLPLAEKSLEAYFTGKPPLKEPKIRKDIPDSFIFQSISELHSTYNDELFVVVEDGALRGACENAGISCYKALSDFIASSEAQGCLAKRIVKDNRERLLRKVYEVANNENDQIISEVESLLLSDEYRMLSGGKIPGENGEIYVSLVSRPHSLELEEVEYLGGGLFVIYFNAHVELVYEYPVYITDSFDLDPKKFYISPLNDHYVEVETTNEFRFIGRVELEFPVDFDSMESVEQALDSVHDPIIEIAELEDFEISA